VQATLLKSDGDKIRDLPFEDWPCLLLSVLTNLGQKVNVRQRPTAYGRKYLSTPFGGRFGINTRAPSAGSWAGQGCDVLLLTSPLKSLSIAHSLTLSLSLAPPVTLSLSLARRARNMFSLTPLSPSLAGSRAGPRRDVHLLSRSTKRPQGYLTHEKQRPPRALQWAYAWSPTVVRGFSV